MPLIYENQEKMRKLFTELFLIFEELVFPEISRELPPKYVIKKYLYGMLDTTGKAFVKSTIAKSIFDKDTSQKIVEIIMKTMIF